MMKGLVLVMGLFEYSLATVEWGKCLEPSLEEDFGDRVSDYMGLWFEQRRSRDITFENGGCEEARYSIDNAGVVSILNSEYDPASDEITKAEAVAYFKGARADVFFNPTSWISKLFQWIVPKRLTAGDYRVASTDYTSYAIVYSCRGFLLWKVEFLWLLTRERYISDEEANAFLANAPPYDTNKLSITSQETCKYL